MCGGDAEIKHEKKRESEKCHWRHWKRRREQGKPVNKQREGDGTARQDAGTKQRQLKQAHTQTTRRLPSFLPRGQLRRWLPWRRAPGAEFALKHFACERKNSHSTCALPLLFPLGHAGLYYVYDHDIAAADFCVSCLAFASVVKTYLAILLYELLSFNVPITCCAEARDRAWRLWCLGRAFLAGH